MTRGASGEPAVGESVPPSSAERETVVRLERIRKRFGYREALRGLDLEVRRGECAVLFGANGAGKSTLLRIIATQWKPSSGEGTVFGWDLRRHAARIRRSTGVVFHQSFLRPELTLEENLRFAADLYDTRLGDDSEDLVERLGLTQRRRDLVHTFSQGMTKRANIIRSLLHDPELWLLDEPFSGLDPDGREVFREIVRDFCDRGRTVILVTHQQELGRNLASRTLEFDDGVLRASVAGGAP